MNVKWAIPNTENWIMIELVYSNGKATLFADNVVIAERDVTLTVGLPPELDIRDLEF